MWVFFGVTALLLIVQLLLEWFKKGTPRIQSGVAVTRRQKLVQSRGLKRAQNLGFVIFAISVFLGLVSAWSDWQSSKQVVAIQSSMERTQSDVSYLVQESVRPVGVVSDSVALPLGDGCPPPHDDRQSSRTTIEVFWWCAGNAIDDNGNIDELQIQIKVRLGVTVDPRATEAVNVAIKRPSAIRYLVPCDGVELTWRPPPKTAAAGDKPVCLSLDGQRYWAIPPNLNDDAQQAKDGQWNFASHWDVEAWGLHDAMLLPGGHIGDDSHADAPTEPGGRGNTSTDLVFTTPTWAIERSYGIALFDTGGTDDPSGWRVLATCKNVDGCMGERNRVDPSTF